MKSNDRGSVYDEGQSVPDWVSSNKKHERYYKMENVETGIDAAYKMRAMGRVDLVSIIGK